MRGTGGTVLAGGKLKSFDEFLTRRLVLLKPQRINEMH